jgi:hypothetical protein
MILLKFTTNQAVGKILRRSRCRRFRPVPSCFSSIRVDVVPGSKTPLTEAVTIIDDDPAFGTIFSMRLCSAFRPHFNADVNSLRSS